MKDVVEMHKETYILTVFIAYLISFIVLCIAKLKLWEYMFFVFPIIVFVTCYYNNKANLVMIRKIGCISLGFLLASIIFVLNTEEQTKQYNTPMILFALMLIPIFKIFIQIIFAKEDDNNDIKKDQIFKLHEADLYRLKSYLTTNDISSIGINGAWGTGKSFIVQKLINDYEIKAKYEVIEIDLLTCNLNEIDIVLLDYIDRCLKSNGIFSSAASEIRQVPSSNFFIQYLKNIAFNNTNTLSSSYKDIKEKVSYLDKKILIVYEDIDRISDINIIKKIFSISEKLMGEKICFLYQYDISKLLEMKIDHHYLEKYVPYSVNITKMSFHHILICVYEEYKDKLTELGVSQLDISSKLSSSNIIKKYTSGFNKSDIHGLVPENLSIRSVKNYLKDVLFMLESKNCSRITPDYKKILYAVLYLKHFRNREYNKLEVGVPVEKTFKIVDKLIDNKYENFSSVEDDISSNCLGLLGYKSTSSNSNEDAASIREYNNRVNHIIWNILAAGVPEYTEYDNALKNFEKLIMPSTEFNIEENWIEFVRNSSEAFGPYTSDMVKIFSIFYIKDVDERMWLKLIDVYEWRHRDKFLTEDDIKIILNCELLKNNILFRIIDTFSRLKVNYNFNDNCLYFQMLKTAIDLVSTHIHFNKFNILNNNKTRNANIDSKNLLDYLQEIKKELNKKEEYYLKEYSIEIQKIILKEKRILNAFIDKNIEIISCKNSIDRSKPF